MAQFQEKVVSTLASAGGVGSIAGALAGMPLVANGAWQVIPLGSDKFLVITQTA